MASLHVREVGAGPVVLLVHGFPLDGSLWDAQLEGLQDEFRVLAPDLRGFGNSPVTAGRVTMAELADDLAELLDERGITEPVVLGGLSMGGYVAWEFWRRHRQRLRGLVLAHTRAAADSAEVARGREMTALRVEEQGPSELADTMAQKLFSLHTQQNSPELVVHWRQRMAQQSSQGVAAALRGMAARDDMTGLLAQVDLPVLAVAGVHDPIIPPEETRQMAAQLKHSRYVELAIAAHMGPVEEPQEFNAALHGFLLSLA